MRVIAYHLGGGVCMEVNSTSSGLVVYYALHAALFFSPVVSDFSAELTTNLDMVVSNARLEFTCSLASSGDQSLLSFIPTGDVTYQITGPGGQVLVGVAVGLVGPNDGGSYTCNATLEGSYLDTSGGSIDFTSAALDVIVYSMSVYTYIHIRMYVVHVCSCTYVFSTHIQSQVNCSLGKLDLPSTLAVLQV